MKIKIPQKGQIVQSICGRDGGSYYIVLSTCGGRALVVDGVKRKLENPKPKNIKHLKILPSVAEIDENGSFDCKVAEILKQLKTEE